MRSHHALAGVAALFLFLVATIALAQPLPPELTRPVNDFAGVIDADSERQLESLIRSLQETTGDVVVVATVDTFQPYGDINEYAVKMFENHGKGIGQGGKDNGLLVLVAIKDRMTRIEVGYDLEQFIPDGFAGETRDEMASHFRRGAYGAGLVAGATRIIGRIAEGRGVTLQGAPRTRAPESPSGGNLIGVLIVVFILINAIAGRLRRRGRRRWGGGPWSGWNSGVGPFGGGGFGRGGGFGGGFGGFGGGGGGGFGGFGGGRSGGGGAGGSW